MTREHTSAWQQLYLFISCGLRLEFSNKERILSSFLFAAVILVVTAVCFATPAAVSTRVLVAEIYLAFFLAMQIACLRIFEFEQRDGVYDLLRTYPLNGEIWYLSKLLVFIISSLLFLLPLLLLAFIFNSRSDYEAFLFVLGIAALVLVGQAALGVLLTTIVLRARGRNILYPLTYFPLTMPLLIGAAETSYAYLEKGAMDDSQLKWITLLIGIDIVYLTLGLLLFGEQIEN